MQRVFFAMGPGVALLLTLVLAGYVWKHRRNVTGSGVLIGLMAGLGVWSLGAVLDLFVRSPTVALRLSQIQYLGITAVVPLWWLFVDRYIHPFGRDSPVESRICLWIVPVFVVVMAFTNARHGWVWQEIALRDTLYGRGIVYRHGPVVYLFAVYACLLLCGTALRLFRTARTSRGLHKRQAGLLIGATLFPLPASVFYLAGEWIGRPLIDITPLAFVVSVALLMANLRKYKFLSVSRVAYDALFHDIEAGVLVVDSEGQLLDCNEAACRLLKRDAPENDAPLLEDWLKDRPEMLEWLRGRSRELHLCGVDKNEPCLLVRNVSLSGKYRRHGLESLFLILDITESCREASRHRHELEEAAQDQKMESVARLAGGVAHDFNNMLQGIIGFGDLLLARIPGDSDLREDVLEILKAARRAADLTGQLLSFSRRQIVVPSEISLTDEMREMGQTLREMCGSGVRLNLRIDDQVPRVKGNAGQLRQAVMNMVSNAIEAMPAGGSLDIALNRVRILESETSMFGHEARAGNFARLSIRDTGHGFSGNIQSNLFEPFFTTRKNQKGTGMGLAVAYGIVKQHQGWIDVWSEPGEGAQFSIYLPLMETTSSVQREQAVEPAELKGRGQCILLVEDEPTVRLLAHRTLESSGYRVLDARGAREAMAAVERKAPIDLVFSDVELQDGNGVDLAARIREIKPDIPILLTSGYTDDRARWESIQKMNLRLLVKPYPVDELLKTLRSELDRPAGCGGLRT